MSSNSVTSRNSPRRRRLVLLATVAITVVLTVGALYAYRKHRNTALAARWRAEGLAARARGDYPGAVEKLSLYLGRQPDDVEALAAYVDARPHVESPQYRHLAETIRALRYLLQIDPTRNAERRQLLDLYERVGMRTESIETADALLRADGRDTHALEVKARALGLLHRYPEALAVLDRWLTVEPTNLSAHVSRMTVLGATGRTGAEIVADVDQWGAAHPDQAPRYELLKGVAYAGLGDRASAQTWLRKAAGREPPDDAFTRLLITQLAAAGDVGEDVTVLGGLVARGAGQEFRRALLLRLWELGRYPEVVELIGKWKSSEVAGAPAGVLAIGVLACRSANQAAVGESLVAQLKAQSGPVAAAWAAVVGTLPADTAGIRSLVTRCDDALAVEPHDAHLRYFRGEALARLREQDAAVESWSQAAADAPGWAAPLTRMAEVLLDLGRPDRAGVAAVQAWARSHDFATAAVAARVAVAISESTGGELRPEVRQLVEQIAKVVPQDPEVRLLEVRTLAAEGKRDAAADALRGIVRGDPPAAEDLLLRIAAISRARQLGVESEALARSEAAHGVTPALALAKAAGEFEQGRPAEAINAFRRVREPAAGAATLEWRVAEARCLDAAADSTAKSAWVALSEQFPADLGVQRAALASRALRGDRPASEKVIARLRALLGADSLTCDLARVRLLVETRAGDADDRELAETLRRVIAAHPELPEPRALWAESLRRAGRVDEAIDQLQLAVAANPEVASLSISLARLYQSKGDYDRASQLLERAARSKARTQGEARQAALMLAREGNSDAALAVLDGATGKAALEDTLARAELHLNRGEVEQAWAVLQPHIEEPKAEVIELAARLCAARHDRAAAEAMLGRLDGCHLDAANAAIVRGRVYAALGDGGRADEQYRAATESAPKNPAAWQARVTYLLLAGRADAASAALDGAMKAAAPAIASWADPIRAAWPLLVTAVNDADLRALAVTYLGDPVNNAASLDAIRAAHDLASMNEPLQALAQARSLSQRFPRFAGVQRIVIRTYLRARRYDEAIASARRLVETLPDALDARALLSACLATAGRWPEALTAAREWRAKCHSGDVAQVAAADVAVARALLGLGKPADAEQTLTADVHAARPPGQPPAGGEELVLAYADALHAQAKDAEAAEVLLPLAAVGPSWRAMCAEFAASRLSAADARSWLSRLEASADHASPDDALTLARSWATLAVRYPKESGDAAERAIQAFRSLVAPADAPLAAIEQAAVFAEQRGELAEAMTLYRRVLARDGGRAVALNEMAYLLATTHGDAAEEALQDAKAAVAAAPGEPEFLDTLASIESHGGDLTGATACYRRAIDLDPDNARWRVSLAEALLADGHPREAGDALITAEEMATAAVNAGRPALAQPLRDRIASLRSRLPASSLNAIGPTTNASAVPAAVSSP